jgi:hypothetical protein
MVITSPRLIISRRSGWLHRPGSHQYWACWKALGKYFKVPRAGRVAGVWLEFSTDNPLDGCCVPIRFNLGPVRWVWLPRVYAYFLWPAVHKRLLKAFGTERTLIKGYLSVYYTEKQGTRA